MKNLLPLLKNPVYITSAGTKFQHDDYCATSTKARMERNDCVVRAIAASFEIPYDEAHSFVKGIFNRKDKDGTRYYYILRMNELTSAFGKSVQKLGKRYEDHKQGKLTLDRKYWAKGGHVYRAMSVGSFLKEYSTGKYLVFVKGHAFAVVDGVVKGNMKDATKLKVRINSAFKIGE